ncbi:MAG: acetolactate synthase [Verrucomicrobiota bacterium]
MRVETSETTANLRNEPVIQFSVFIPNQVGRLNELIQLLGAQDVHVLALTALDTTESTIVRLVVDDPEKSRLLLSQAGFAFTESQPVVVALDHPGDLGGLVAALLEAELNINYLYSFIPHPGGKSILGLSMEDNEVAEKVLRQHQFVTLRQSDLSR